MNPEALWILVLATAGVVAFCGAIKAADVIHQPTVEGWAIVGSIFVSAVMLFQSAWNWQPPPQ